jgi:transposase, IS30 family
MPAMPTALIVERRREMALRNQRIVDQLKDSVSFEEIARSAGCSASLVSKISGSKWAGPKLLSWNPGPKRLSLGEREEIRVGVVRGDSDRKIARTIGRAPSTVSRELTENGGRERYEAWRAHQRAGERARRPKKCRLEARPELAGFVCAALRAFWSPEKIARTMREVFPDRPMMWVSHETIYRSIYVQGRGELRRELARCLRSGRAHRRPQHREEHRGKIADMVMISERPAEVADRAVPGHWEGDLIIGKNGASAVGTLVERATRYVILLHLPNGHTAQEVRDAMTKEIVRLPAELRRSVTWDQGKEMSQHKDFTIETGIPVYFCDPHSPWQRATNENTNGLLRQYMPKGTDLSKHSRRDLDEIASSLNWRPRETIGFKAPTDALAALVAMTV